MPRWRYMLKRSLLVGIGVVRLLENKGLRRFWCKQEALSAVNAQRTSLSGLPYSRCPLTDIHTAPSNNRS
ncbi:hypothetical protein AKJ16_DCAP22975 [Drosera capensis]